MNQQENGVVKKRKDNTLQELEEEQMIKESDVKCSKATFSPRTITLIFVSLLLDLLAFTMILPLLPSLLDYYNKEEGKGNSLYASLLQAIQTFQKFTGAPDRFSSVLFGGVLGSMYSFLQFLTSPIVGSLSDAYGRKPMLIICLTGIALSHALWGCARTFSVFVMARFIGGLSKANVSLSMAIVTDASNEKTRARGMALIGLAFSVGFIVGPLAGAWFAATHNLTAGAWGERPAFYALLLSLTNVALVVFFMPETLPKEKRSPLLFTLSKTLDFVSPWHLLKFSAVKNLSEHQNKVLTKVGLIYFLYLFIYSGLEFTLTFLTHHTFQYTAMQQGKMFLVIGAIMAVLQGGAARRLGAAGAERAARAALALTPLSFLSVAAAAAPRVTPLSPAGWLWLGLVLFAVSTAFAVSCLSSVAAGQAPAAARGAALGALRSLGALARAAGPLLAASVYWISGATTTYTIGAVILIIPAVMMYRLKI
ncbi:major facilitator superfamily domain-containing protein 10 [Achroia grisella]|uniref:major facilitator superfamily domain-containing protein 10 n=1 Tax=Achroia grisella TaxID=688607 RepID=UPI0027D2DC17|nr:major facilitator superfamily domain-containing protein 10 [Achroia grisella]